MKLSAEQARRIWFARSLKQRKGPAEILRHTGWIHSAGSASPYVAFRARMAKCTREGIDRAFGREIVEVLSVRSSTMLVPRDDLPVALASGRRAQAFQFKRLCAKCKVTEREIRELGAAIVRLLEEGPLPPDEIRGRLPPHLIRNLGNMGRLLGTTSTLPVALKVLQVAGAILRFPQNGRLDDRQHVYKLVDPPPEMLPDTPDIDRELARRFFHWASPATLDEFAWWAWLGKRAARDAMAGLKLEAVSIPGWSDEAWLDPEAEVPPKPSGTFFLPFRDNCFYFRRGLGIFLRPENGGLLFLDWRGRHTPIAKQETLHHNAIAADGRLVGAWEYDPEEKKVVLVVLEDKPVDKQLAELEKWIAAEIGDLNFYSFDSGQGRRRRIDSLCNL